MKKTLFLLFASIAIFTSSVNAQNIYSDASFLKATNHLFSACFSIDAIIKAENKATERTTLLPLIKANLNASTKYYDAIKSKFQNDKQLTQWKLWNDVLQKGIEGLNSESWENDSMWQMGYSLLKLDVLDMVNKKLK